MLTDILKRETARSHASLEKVIVADLKSLSSKSSYASILKYYYNFIAPVENRINTFLANDMPLGLCKNKSELLKKDIMFLEEDFNIEPQLSEATWINNKLEAVGALYVLEGSTLGSVHISKMIIDRLGNSIAEGINYFTVYGKDTYLKWDEFKLWVNSLDLSKQEVEDVVASANFTFVQFENSIVEHVN